MKLLLVITRCIWQVPLNNNNNNKRNNRQKRLTRKRNQEARIAAQEEELLNIKVELRVAQQLQKLKSERPPQSTVNVQGNYFEMMKPIRF